jgi:hypothetical protein
MDSPASAAPRAPAASPRIATLRVDRRRRAEQGSDDEGGLAAGVVLVDVRALDR